MKLRSRTDNYLAALGVSRPQPATVAFDPGYDHVTLAAHVEQSGHLLYAVKLSMATWQIAAESAVFAKIQAIRRRGLPVIAGGGAFEIAASFSVVPSYLDLCVELGFSRVEVSEGFGGVQSSPDKLVPLARDRGLEVQFEVGRKFGGAFRDEEEVSLCMLVQQWLDGGAEQIVVEAREDALGVGLFNAEGELNRRMTDRLVEAAGGELRRLQFEAPTKRSQFALLEHLGSDVVLANVRLEEVLRVEIFRLGLHSRSFLVSNLRPKGP